MYCPYCQWEESRVLETRREPAYVQRRRRCVNCGQRFTTLERINVEYLTVRKADGQVERFQRAKIIRGLEKAASVFRIPATDINAFIDRILDQLQPETPGLPIATSDIGNLVLRHLQDATSVTDVARIRFAMVFKGKTSRRGGFSDASDLADWLGDNYPGLSDLADPAVPMLVLKRPPREAQPFDLAKLERSVGIAAKGRGSDLRVRALASDVAARATADLAGQPIVTSHQIAAFVMKCLRSEDDIAYLRYAATTKPLRSVEDFWRETLALVDRRAKL